MKTFVCGSHDVPGATMPELPADDGTSGRTPWLSKWEFVRNGRRYRVAVKCYPDDLNCPMTIEDPRSWIERLGEAGYEEYEICVQEVT